jgi:hypothetical protein
MLSTLLDLDDGLAPRVEVHVICLRPRRARLVALSALGRHGTRYWQQRYAVHQGNSDSRMTNGFFFKKKPKIFFDSDSG